MKFDRSELTKADLKDAAEMMQRLGPTVIEAQVRIHREYALLSKRLKPLLTVLHGIPVALWMRMAQDEYGRTGRIEFAHIMRSLCARIGHKEPHWAAEALLEQSHTTSEEALLKRSDAICEDALRFQIDSRPGRVNAVQRAIRDFRLAYQIPKTERARRISRKKAFKAVTKMLPAKNSGEWFSEQTPKRAWRRYCSERSYKQLYK